VEAPRAFTEIERFLPIFIESSARAAESTLAARRREMRRAAAVNPARIEAPFGDAPGIPFAFELWIIHLGELDRLAGGVAFTLDDLTPEEARGLALLRRAREHFWAEHQKCPGCNSLMSKSQSFCGTCGRG
jgi:hypothetical protein